MAPLVLYGHMVGGPNTAVNWSTWIWEGGWILVRSPPVDWIFLTLFLILLVVVVVVVVLLLLLILLLLFLLLLLQSLAAWPWIVASFLTARIGTDLGGTRRMRNHGRPVVQKKFDFEYGKDAWG